MSIEKKVGDAISASVKFEYRGPAIQLRVVWGLMPASSGAAYTSRAVQVYDNIHSVLSAGDWTLVTVSISAVFPVLAYQADSADKADAVVAIYLPGSNQPSILTVYYEDVYNLPAPVSEFRNLQASFS